MKLAGEEDLPSLSVTVLMFVGREYLVRCLDALLQQTLPEPVEVLVLHDDRLSGVEELQRRFPGVRWLGLPGRRSPAELRALGIASSRAPIVALLEDHCLPRADWCARVLAAHDRPHVAIGGAVEKGLPPGRSRDSGLNWALYLTDYSRYMLPLDAGPAPSLTDCNVSYKRARLDAHRDAWQHEFHENVVHGLIEADGLPLWLDPEIVVFEQRTLSLAAVLRDRFSFGRLFGATRVAGAPLAARLRFAAFALALPPVLVLRAGGNLFRRRRHRSAFVRALPALILTTSTWMAGEFVGYITGVPPASLAVEGGARPASAPAHGA